MTIKRAFQTQNRFRAKSKIQYDNLGWKIPRHILVSFLTRKLFSLERSQGWKISIKFNFAGVLYNNNNNETKALYLSKRKQATSQSCATSMFHGPALKAWANSLRVADEKSS
jgi:hypothetical protein